MTNPLPSTLSAAQVMDTYFLETRAKLLEIAATLDRVDRGRDLAALRGDPRLIFIHEALEVLQSAAPNRAERILNLYSIA